MNEEMFSRTIGLLGEENFRLLRNKTVALFGLGGVGGTVFECLLRSGVSHFVIVDFDQVALSNLNRQILYTSEDVGSLKVETARSHALKISPESEITALNLKINEENIHALDAYSADYIIDAIDDVNGKLAICQYATAHQIPFIISLGMANRMDPTQVKVIRLDKSTGDPLAKKVRYLFKNAGVDTRQVMCAISMETPFHDGNRLNSMMMVPSAAGLAIANYVINDFIHH